MAVDPTQPRRRPRDDRGQATVLVVGLAVVLAMAVAMVVDATAAYLQRSGLNTLADGAALRGADVGATGRDVYEGGVPTGRLEVTADAARREVHTYLVRTGAYEKYPGLRFAVSVDPGARAVGVRLEAPLDLPLTLPGSPSRPTVGAEGSAVVTADG